jgi:hypothetical protein
VREAHAAVTDLLPRLSWLRGIAAQVRAAKSFDSLSPDAQAIELCHALMMRLQERDARIINLESTCAALEARLDRLEHRTKKPKQQSKVAA